MISLNPQFITDKHGKKKSVVLSIEDFKALMEELQEVEDIKMYDLAKLGDQEFVVAEQAFKEIEEKRSQKT
ncbi:MAG: hypothetical protein WAT79_16150 [Saprospiraceae bacterium]